jgi:hypothetical protein
MGNWSVKVANGAQFAKTRIVKLLVRYVATEMSIKTANGSNAGLIPLAVRWHYFKRELH